MTDFTELVSKNFNDNYQIAVYGTNEEPLFKATEIGNIIGIKNIKDAIKDFDEDEKSGVVLTDPHGRKQETNMLKENGLYRLLMKSRKPIARQFQKWICNILKELRLTGEYKLKKEIEEKEKEIKEIEQENLKLQSTVNELITIKNLKYNITIPDWGNIYIMKDKYKLKQYRIGKTENIDKRKKMYTSNCVGEKDSMQFIFTKAVKHQTFMECLIHENLRFLNVSGTNDSFYFESDFEAITFVDKLLKFYEKINNTSSIPEFTNEIINAFSDNESNEVVNEINETIDEPLNETDTVTNDEIVLEKKLISLEKYQDFLKDKCEYGPYQVTVQNVVDSFNEYKREQNVTCNTSNLLRRSNLEFALKQELSQVLSSMFSKPASIRVKYPNQEIGDILKIHNLQMGQTLYLNKSVDAFTGFKLKDIDSINYLIIFEKHIYQNFIDKYLEFKHGGFILAKEMIDLFVNKYLVECLQFTTNEIAKFKNEKSKKNNCYGYQQDFKDEFTRLMIQLLGQPRRGAVSNCVYTRMMIDNKTRERVYKNIVMK